LENNLFSGNLKTIFSAPARGLQRGNYYEPKNRLFPGIREEQLIKSFYTKRKKDVMEFDYGDSGKTVCFAVIVENGGKQGPVGPLVSALIL
jgi:hypothetical protein